MRCVFRADASVRLGNGHVRRCLSLARQLQARDAAVLFVCTDAPGNMIEQIAACGAAVARLPAGEERCAATSADDCDWRLDAQHTRDAMASAGFAPHWLVVDHYRLDARWERTLRGEARHIMAIDDLADRPHDCDLLLDQNLANPRHARYAQLLPAAARRLFGPQYALLGPEFAQQRDAALARRRGQLGCVLISMGATDPRNDTATALAGLALSRYAGVAVDVVVGAANPHRAALAAHCAAVPGCRLHVQTTRMAELMARADLAITAAGSTTWERCALGLPAITVVQSDDQSAVAAAVAEAGAHVLLGAAASVTAADYASALDGMSAGLLLRMSAAAAALCDGLGAERTAALLSGWSEG